MKNNKLEIACFNIESALIAQQGGADRIELCDNFSVGGITPHFEIVQTARKKIEINLLVMIRPRGGNFIYTNEEFEKMKTDLLSLKKLGVNGFVFGILNTNLTVNSKQNSKLVELAHPLPCTFHRAFDLTPNSEKALNHIVESGFKTILSSGHKSSALEGTDELSKLIIQGSNKITIMPGGGVRSTNIHEIELKTNACFYHSSAILKGDIADIEEVKSLKNKLH